MAGELTFGSVLSEIIEYPEFYEARNGETIVRFSEIDSRRLVVDFVPPVPVSRQEKVFRWAVAKAIELYGDKTGEYMLIDDEEGLVMRFPEPNPYGRPRCETLGEITKPAGVTCYPKLEHISRTQNKA